MAVRELIFLTKQTANTDIYTLQVTVKEQVKIINTV